MLLDMSLLGALCYLLALTGLSAGQDAPTVYEYYTQGGVTKGLEALSTGFKLNGKDFQLRGGEIHYFRVHPAYWRDRLRKLRAAGLTSVQIYVPWNLHEPEKDLYDFGQAGRDMSHFLDIETFLKIAQEEDLFVTFRPGPYICAELEFGGLPSWLLRIPNIKLRTSEKQYFDRVEKYFNQLLPLVAKHQFTKNGSIIAVQLENEYSTVGHPEGPEKEYLYALKRVLENNGIQEMFYTSDNTLGDGFIPEAQQTINFQSDVPSHLTALKDLQPDKPIVVMEYWTGWFDHWFEDSGRLGFTPQEYGQNLEAIIQFPGDFSLYMFHGGSSWGFLNGANANNPDDRAFDVSSYDYAAPLSEAGDYTEKYDITKTILQKYSKVAFKTPPQPEETLKVVYDSLQVQDYIPLSSLFDTLVSVDSDSVTNMEALPINNGNGQSYGWVWYHREGAVPAGSTLQVSGRVHDAAQVLVGGKLQGPPLGDRGDVDGFGFWKKENAELQLSDSGSGLDILVENMGRINYGPMTYGEKKGLYDGPVLLNGEVLTGWKIAAIEFNKTWLQSLQSRDWSPLNDFSGPALYRTTLHLTDTPQDTFLDLRGWTKGLVVINNFVLSRYNFLGPQHSAFLPAPLLQKGDNTIYIFEQYKPGTELKFTDSPILG